MKVNLLENQIDIILKSLENYIVTTPEKRQLIYATYESLLSQKVNNINTCKRNENVILKFKKVVDNAQSKW